MEGISIRISGANGDGIESAGALLSQLLAHNGLYVFGFRGYQSVIRGGLVWYQVRASNSRAYSIGNSVDVFVALTSDALEAEVAGVEDNGIVIYDSMAIKTAPQVNTKVQLAGVPLTAMALKSGGGFIYRNSVAIGIIGKLLGIDEKTIDIAVGKAFKRKPEEIEKNINAVNSGYDLQLDVKLEKKLSIGNKPLERYLLSGNSAIAIGAYAAGCKFYAAYPMTPASSIMEWFALHEPLGVFFKQTEDEIAAINMAIGAASTGARAMCGTSGGGFSLMVEALGLAGMIEVPIVVVESQRGGPSTGLPTKTEQGDILFAIHASQGEFPRIVLAPRSIEECFYMTVEAFNLADKYQCPVILMVDLFLSEHSESVNLDPENIVEERGDIATAPEQQEGRFMRYRITDSGVSPRSLPGSKGLSFVASSDEHDEYGNLISDVLAGIPKYIELRKKMHDKRMRKIDTMLKDGAIGMPTVINEGADVFMLAFGSTTESATEALEVLKDMGINAGLISFAYLHPMPSDKIKKLLEGKRLIDVECNATGQFAKLIAMNTGIVVQDKVLKYDGEAITSGEIAAGVAKYVGKV